jgi:hypothetical protein
MNATQESGASPARPRRWGRRVAAVLAVGMVLFVALWAMAFSALTSLIVASSTCIVVTGLSTAFDLVEAALEAITTMMLAMLGAIAAVFAAIFSIFDF